MPHVPDLNHDRHDLELVVAFASGDAAGTSDEAGAALVAYCASCAELNADLRAIAAAMPQLPVRPRTRDYRLSPQQATALRLSGWRRALAALAAPRAAFTAPLGTGLAALGIAGLLITSVPTLFGAGSSAPAAGSQERTDAQITAASEAPSIDNAAPPSSMEVTVAASDAPRDAQGEPSAVPQDDFAKVAAAAGEAPLPAVFGALLTIGVLLVAIRRFARRFAACD